MAEERHTTAFVVGAVLGGLAGAAATLWKIPWSGAETRAQIAEQAENLLFRMTGMNEWRADNVPLAGTPIPVESAPNPDSPATGETAASPHMEPPASPPVEQAADEDGATLPLTFRGEVLTDHTTEQDPPADVVLDGPRSAPPDR